MTDRATVSVIIPVFQAGKHLAECLDSVVGQTIGLAAVQIVAIDDGSTDDSPAILDRYAARVPGMVVVHEPNSGGPGRPRNVGLDHATGTFVFFLDADDYLGPEALARMVAAATRNESDVVLGRMVAIDGRKVPTHAFRRNLERARVEDVYSSLAVLKLFRRSLIERLALRFDEGLAAHEDGVFTALAYFGAAGISVVGDYDCYHVRRGSVRGRAVGPSAYLAVIARRVDVVIANRPPGPERDRLMKRHVVDIVRAFSSRWLALDPQRRAQVFDVAAALIARGLPADVSPSLPPGRALRLYCLRHGLRTELEDIVACPDHIAMRDPIVEGRLRYARYPHFRDGAGIPDALFAVGAPVSHGSRWGRVPARVTSAAARLWRSALRGAGRGPRRT